MPLIPLETIVAGENVRAHPVAAMAEEGLTRSIAAQGVLQPILLRALTDAEAAGHPGKEWKIVLGARRVRAATAAGHAVIPADCRVDMTDAQAAEAQLAENIQREAMHPVDQWRAVRGLIQDHGLSFEQAAGALGLDHRVTRKLEMLGRLNPTLLKLAEIEMPGERQIRVIAAAPPKLQREVAKARDLVSQRGEREHVAWDRVTERCQLRRIPRARAAFAWRDVKGLVWDEDLFAEPGSDEQFTTADAEGFVKHQTEALRAQVAALTPAGRHQMAVMRDTWRIALPGGFKEVLGGDPDKLKRHETAFHAVSADGEIVVQVGLDTKAAKPKGGSPADQAPAEARADGAATDTPDLDGDGENAAAAAPVIKPAVSKKGLALIAAAKDAALCTALAATPMTPAQALGLLVLALAGDNVTVGGAHEPFDLLAFRLLGPGGTLLTLSDADLVAISQTALGRMVQVRPPDAPGYCRGSGDAAEWIGAAVRAGDHLARFDTEEFLATASLAELKRAAAGAGLLTSGTGAQLRERLTGRAEAYRPEAAVFGAPAPTPRHGATP